MAIGCGRKLKPPPAWQNGELAEIHCLVSDITDRKQVEAALRESEGNIVNSSELFRGIGVSSLQDGTSWRSMTLLLG